MVSYQLSVYILFWPIVLGVILTKPSKKGAVLSMASGAFVGIVFSCFRLGIYQDWVVLSISMIAYFIGYYLDVKKNKALKVFLPNSSGQLTIGIIGGAGPLAGVLLCEYIIQLCQQRYQCKDDADFPKLVLLSIPFAQMLKTDRVDDNELVVRKQLSNALSSVSALASKIGIACNTLHGFIEQSQLQKICNMVQLTSLYINITNLLIL